MGCSNSVPAEEIIGCDAGQFDGIPREGCGTEPRQWQDVAVALYLIILGSALQYGTSGPDGASRHTSTHVHILILSIFPPFMSFNWCYVKDVPEEGWILCFFMFFAQCLHTGVHVKWPDAPHNLGPEILSQPLLCMWVTQFVRKCPPHVWYRGDAGAFLFTVSTFFTCLAVVMVIYHHGTTIADDVINFQTFTLTSNGNYFFTLAGGTSLLLSFYVAWGNAMYVMAAMVFQLLFRVCVIPTKSTIRNSSLVPICGDAVFPVGDSLKPQHGQKAPGVYAPDQVPAPAGGPVDVVTDSAPVLMPAVAKSGPSGTTYSRKTIKIEEANRRIWVTEM